jgi:hypothetical protein
VQGDPAADYSAGDGADSTRDDTDLSAGVASGTSAAGADAAAHGYGRRADED